MPIIEPGSLSEKQECYLCARKIPLKCKSFWAINRPTSVSIQRPLWVKTAIKKKNSTIPTTPVFFLRFLIRCENCSVASTTFLFWNRNNEKLAFSKFETPRFMLRLRLVSIGWKGYIIFSQIFNLSVATNKLFLLPSYSARYPMFWRKSVTL